MNSVALEDICFERPAYPSCAAAKDYRFALMDRSVVKAALALPRPGGFAAIQVLVYSRRCPSSLRVREAAWFGRLMDLF